MRAGLACLSASGREVELLLLDEPTNNLVIVVSHDEEFPARIGPERTLTLERSPKKRRVHD